MILCRCVMSNAQKLIRIYSFKYMYACAYYPTICCHAHLCSRFPWEHVRCFRVAWAVADAVHEHVGVATPIGVRELGSEAHSVRWDRANKTADNPNNRSIATARSSTTSVAYILYMDLVYILAGVFITAIAVSLILGKINGTLIW